MLPAAGPALPVPRCSIVSIPGELCEGKPIIDDTDGAVHEVAHWGQQQHQREQEQEQLPPQQEEQKQRQEQEQQERQQRQQEQEQLQPQW
mmetsp:Transcript_33324/g.83513  ORF Transcript_33324/g.83513 Transcript_33324/m.83513 type:complete len:90 (+) Transcript_33324:102-371(+)